MNTIDIKSPEWLAFQAAVSEVYSTWITETEVSGVFTLQDAVLAQRLSDLAHSYGWTDAEVATANDAEDDALYASLVEDAKKNPYTIQGSWAVDMGDEPEDACEF